MNIENIRKWKHVMKLDPDKKISEKNLEKIIGSGSDALMVSGTQNVTRRNVEKILRKSLTER
jgi:heptaprenylglyceryl phosphate synthase